MIGNTELSKEQRVMRMMRMVLANIVKDTTPQPGMHHPLSQQTIEDIKACFALISARETELAEEAGLAQEQPYFTDDPHKAKVVSINKASQKNRKLEE